jgi:hypothetical protein
MAGEDWLYGFLKRHPQLTLRQPEATNLSRAVGFHKEQVGHFFRVYTELLQGHLYGPLKAWNVDETGISTVQKLVRVLATKGA